MRKVWFPRRGKEGVVGVNDTQFHFFAAVLWRNIFCRPHVRFPRTASILQVKGLPANELISHDKKG